MSNLNSRLSWFLVLTALALPVQADELSGPGRLSLANEAWGSIYYVPQELQEYQYQRQVEAGIRTMTSHFGKVTMNDSGLGNYQLAFPHGKASVEGNAESARVEFFGGKYEFAHDQDHFTVKTPEDEIHYTFAPHLITAVGKKGTLKITDKDGDYRVESPMGQYTYTPTPDGGFTVKGGPLAKHPYLYRGVLFEDAGVGIFIDFKKLDPTSPLFKFIEWTPMMQIHGH